MSSTSAPNIYISGVEWNRASVLGLQPLLQCTGCGRCCREPFPITVQEHEVERIAAYLREPVHSLKGALAYKGGWSMSSPCSFRSARGCAIHSARPVVCKYFPLQRCDFEGHSVVGVFTQWCDAGRACIEQLERWQRWA